MTSVQKAALFLAVLLAGTCLGQSKWEWRNPLPQGNTILDIAFGNNIFVGVGIIGTIIASTDGKKWTPRSSGTTEDLERIVFAGNQFVVGGIIGKVLTSSDGITWTHQEIGAQAQFTSLTYINGRYLGTGMGWKIYQSRDAKTWTILAELDMPLLEWIGPVVYGNNLYVAPAMVDEYAAIVTSPDCSTWTMQRYHPKVFNSIVYFNSQFMITGSDVTKGYIVTSADGVNWDFQEPGVPLGSEIKIENNLCFIVSYSSNKIINSSDGLKWTISTINTTGHPNSLAYGNERYIAIASDGSTLTSSDAINWTHNNPGNIAKSIFSVLYEEKKFIAVAKGFYGGDEDVAILTSRDGVSWVKNNIGLSHDILLDLAFSGDRYVVVGDSGVVMTSPDASAWTRKKSGAESTLRSVVWGNNTFVAVGGEYDKGVIFTSPDGLTWTDRSLDSCSGLLGVSYANKIFFALGYKNTILTSTDGINWTRRNLGVSDPFGLFESAIYARNLFVLAGHSRVLTSPDCNVWKEYPMEVWMHSITYANNYFVAVCEFGNIVFSPDGENWRWYHSGAREPLYGVTHDDKQFIAVGRSGTILSSPFNPTPIFHNAKTTNSASPRFQAHPGKNGITIVLSNQHSGDKMCCQLFDMSGRKISSITSPLSYPRITIPVSNLASGVYVVTIENNRGMRHRMPVIVK